MTQTMRNIIFFDGVCGLCNAFVDFVIQHDHKKNFLLSSLQSKEAQTLLSPQDLGLNTIVLMENSKIYTQSTAVLRIFFSLGGPWTIVALLASIFPRFFRDFVYQQIAQRRYFFFGQKDFCRLPTAEEKNRFLSF
jgi:predicted DCC family thiol-disulfide oxidoreductase YuxK